MLDPVSSWPKGRPWDLDILQDDLPVGRSGTQLSRAGRDPGRCYPGEGGEPRSWRRIVYTYRTHSPPLALEIQFGPLSRK